MHRLHNQDVCAVIEELGLPYVKLVLPMEYDPKVIIPSKYFKDPRTTNGELLFPEFIPRETVEKNKIELGSHAYCNPGEAPVLMGDLSIKPIAQIKPGDVVVGFETSTERRVANQRFARRRLKLTTVKSVSISRQPVVKVTFASGRWIRCTADHRWYDGRKAGRPLYRPAKIGRDLMRVCPPSLPEIDGKDLRMAGWLSGFFDGEGTVVTQNRHKRTEDYSTALISFAQAYGRHPQLCDQLELILDHFGLDWGVMEKRRNPRHQPARMYWLKRGGLPVYQRFLHVVQPNKWGERIIQAALGCDFIKERERIISIEPDHHDEQVYGLETTTGNYVVWGLASSNSTQYQQQASAREGGIFKRHWFKIVDAVPARIRARVRRWDLAASEAGDWTSGVRMISTAEDEYYIEGVIRFREQGAEVHKTIKTTANTDPNGTWLGLPQDPGQAGKDQVAAYQKENAGHRIWIDRETGSKITRAEPFAAQCEAGNVYLVRGQWNEAFIEELCKISHATINVIDTDQMDAAAGAFNKLITLKGFTVTPEMLADAQRVAHQDAIRRGMTRR